MVKNRYIIVLFTLVIFILFCFLLLTDRFVKLPELNIPKYNLNTIKEGWKMEYDGKIDDISIPFKNNGVVKPFEEVFYINKFPVDYSLGRVLAFKTNNENIKLFSDNIELLSYTNENFVTNKSTLGTYWVFYDIPKELLGKEFKILKQSEDGKCSGSLNNIYLISEADSFYLILKDNYITIIYSIVFLTISTMILIIGIFVLFKRRELNMVYMGVAMIIYTIWMFSTTNVTILLSNHAYFITRLYYISLNMLCPAFVMWIDDSLDHSYQKFTSFYKIVIFSSSVIIFILGFINILTLSYYLKLIYLIFFSIGIIYLYIFINEFFINKKKKIIMQGLMFLTMAIAFLFEFISYYLVGDLYLYMFVQFGSFICIFLIFIHYYKELVSKKLLELENNYLLKIAYIDNLTGAYNRSAFNDDVMKLDKKKKYTLLNLDCNNLKYINDTFGHLSGDMVIKDTYNCIDYAFGKYGKCYRVGGDEFICILDLLDEEKLESSKNRFYNKIKEIDLERDYDFSISIGCLNFVLEDYNNIDEVIKQSDKLMYEDKRKYKKMCSIW